MAKKTKVEAPAPIVISQTETTCGKAVKLSQNGAWVHWRPDSKVNYGKPESDLALILK